MKENSIEEAIERLNRFKTIKIMYGNIFSMHLEQLKQLQEDLETALTYIVKLEKENEELIEIKRVASEFINRKPEQFSIGEFRNKLNYIAELNNEAEIALNNRIIDLETKIEKKDTVIDDMARALKEYANLGFLIKCPAEYDGKYNYKHCKIDITKDRTRKTNRLCIDCIKQYFENKVESEENK